MCTVFSVVNFEYFYGWLPRMDSNHDKQIQNLQCYRYTTRQFVRFNFGGIVIPIPSKKKN